MKTFVSIISTITLLTLSASAQSLGSQLVLNNVQINPATTNQYVVGTMTSTNTSGAGMDEVFIGTWDVDNLGVEVSDYGVTNGSAAVSGPVEVTLSRSVTGSAAESTPYCTIWVNPSTALTGNQTNPVTPNVVGTNLDMSGMAGLYVTSIASTNSGAGAVTNFLTLKVFAKAAKSEAIPSTFRN